MYNNFEVDKEIPYRLYYGIDKKVDWVDIKDIRSSYNFEKVLFEDLSPIIRIKQFKEFYLLEIDKLNSKWNFWYLDSIPQLRLIEPNIPRDENNIQGKIIFEYEEINV